MHLKLSSAKLTAIFSRGRWEPQGRHRSGEQLNRYQVNLLCNWWGPLVALYCGRAYPVWLCTLNCWWYSGRQWQAICCWLMRRRNCGRHSVPGTLARATSQGREHPGLRRCRADGHRTQAQKVPTAGTAAWWQGELRVVVEMTGGGSIYGKWQNTLKSLSKHHGIDLRSYSKICGACILIIYCLTSSNGFNFAALKSI